MHVRRYGPVYRNRQLAEDQYASLRTPLRDALQRQGCVVKHVSFIVGARSLHEQALHENLQFFQVPEVDIESILSKRALTIYDEYANVLT